MLRSILLLGFIFSCFETWGNPKSDFCLFVQNVAQTKDSVTIVIKVTNQARDPYIFLIPQVEDICNNLIHIKINDLNNHQYELFPCTYTAKLSSVILTDKNSLVLPPNKSFSDSLVFSRTVFPKSLIHKQIGIHVELIYSYVQFETSFKNVFQENIRSPIYKFYLN